MWRENFCMERETNQSILLLHQSPPIQKVLHDTCERAGE